MSIERKNQYYIGIDLNDKTAMVSYYQPGMSDPETVSPIAGSQYYQIPVLMAKRSGQEDWLYGDDANRLAKNNEAVCVDALLTRALSNEQIVVGNVRYEAEDILAAYLRKLIALPQMLRGTAKDARLVISVNKVSDHHMDLFYRILPRIGIKEENFSLIDHKTAFYDFALNQPDSQWVHDVYLFECSNRSVRYMVLSRDGRTRPQTVQIQESRKFALSDDLDAEFTGLLREVCEGKAISAIYLVGDGFDGNWMKVSLNYMCRGRKVFLGKNLYSKGACYCAVRMQNEARWPFIYLGENEMKFNLSLRINHRGRSEYYTLIQAGKRWYRMKKECEVILSGSPELEIWKHLPSARKPDVETLELTDLPERHGAATRLHITATAVSDTRVDLEIRDMGFGEFYRSTGKILHNTITV